MADYASIILADNPAGYWRLGESSGNPQDSSGNDNHVTSVTGTPTYSVTGALTGDSNTAVTLDGSAYFSVPYDATFDVADVFTLEAWVTRPTAIGTIIRKGYGSYLLRILSTGDEGPAWCIELVRNDVAEIVESTSGIPATGWHHVVATKNGSTVKLYLDGSDVTGTVSNSTFTDNESGQAIGPDLNGSIDEVAVYNSVLTPAQVRSHYEAGRSQYAAAVLVSDPVAYWRLEETSGSTAVDTVGSNDLTYTNTPTLGQTSLVPGSAVLFESASNEYAIKTSPTGLPSGAADRSIEAWFKVNDTGVVRAIYSQGTLATDQLLYFDVSATGLLHVTTSGTDRNYGSAGSCNDGEWHHVVVTVSSSGTSITVYLDGALLTGATNPQTVPTMNTTLSAVRLGWSGGSQYMNGLIDEVAVYDRVLTTTEIADHYAAGAPTGEEPNWGTWSNTWSGYNSTTYTGSVTANAYIAKAYSGSVSADAYIQKAQSGSVSADAYILKTQDRAALFASDTFTRTESNGWGTADSGGAWTGSSYQSTDGSTAKITWASSAQVSPYLGSVSQLDSDQLVQISIDKLPNSGAVNAGLMARRTGSSTYYSAKLYVPPTGSYRVWLTRNDSFDLGYASPGTYTAGDTYWLRFQIVGSALRAKAWKVGTAEPDWQISATDTNIASAAPVGVFSYATGATNWPIVLTVDNYSGAAPAVLTADAYIQRAYSGSVSADAQIKNTIAGSVSADAYIRKVFSGSVTADSQITSTVAGSVAADAYISKVFSGSVTADSYIKATVQGSVSADAYLKNTVAGSVTADAEIVGSQTYSGSVTANATIKSTLASSISADSQIKNTISGSVSADAYISKVFSGSVTANAQIKNTIAGSVSADAVILKTFTGSVTANSYVKRLGLEGSLTADASIASTVESSIPADAVIKTPISGSITANALIWNTVAGSVTADAFVSKVFGGSATADATIRKTFDSSVSADAAILKVQGGSASADATILKVQAGSVTSDAYLLRVFSGSVTADSYISKTQNGSVSADSDIALIGRPIWTAPDNMSNIEATPTLVFTMPDAVRNMHFLIELDTVNTFDGADLRKYRTTTSQTGWEYWNGSEWTAFPAAGVPNTYAGNSARFTVPVALSNDTWYRIVRGGV